MEAYFTLILFPLLIGIWAQIKIHSKYTQWSQVRSSKGLRGVDAAAAVMEQAGIHDVEIVCIEGKLTDHYDPVHRRLALSRDNYNGTSLAALGVAAHEAGHAIQHKEAYKPLKLRSALIPITNFSCQILPFVLMGGFLMNLFGLIKLAVFIYLILTVFQLITLPVEFDASARAKKLLLNLSIIDSNESVGVCETLNAAAFTYVAAFIASLGQLMYYLMLSQRRND
ncbi:MAG: zinc metallopeptidase [Opitutales bacterium]|nr:zinc metallopeptidase [Opitutales bacterium]